MQHQSNLVRHHPGGHEKPSGFIEQLSHRRLQFVNGRIFSVHVIPYRSGGHSLTHRSCRARDGVTAQINHQ
jgi:hypothetical protein